MKIFTFNINCYISSGGDIWGNSEFKGEIKWWPNAMYGVELGYGDFQETL